MRLLLTLLLLATVPAARAATTNRIGHDGVTWEFSTNVTFGYFVTGDPWVLAPVTITNITPRYNTTDGAENGSMVDPISGVESYGDQGFDSEMGDVYSASLPYKSALNVASNMVAGNWFTLSNNQSLVSAISTNIASPALRPTLHGISVLTALTSDPGLYAFRPSPWGTNKIIWTTNNVRWSILQNLNWVAGAPSYTSFSNKLDKPWNLIHAGVWSQYTHPTINQQNYAANEATTVGNALLLLNLNTNNTVKQPLFFDVIQLGIDIHGAAESGARWAGKGGLQVGRKVLLGTAGLALNDTRFTNYMNYAAFPHFQEDKQLFRVQLSDVGRTVYTNDGKHRVTYDMSHVGQAEWGEQHSDDISRDSSAWPMDLGTFNESADYRGIVGQGFIPSILAVRLMGWRALWNNTNAFDYATRYYSIGNSEPFWDMTQFTTNMMNAYSGAAFETTNTIGGGGAGSGTGSITKAVTRGPMVFRGKVVVQ